ncbi:MAG: AI-2E family transporter [Chloroflexi bacterium]|nr:AI-2E family transporter [Chloroflexota bacterium]
MSEKPSPLPIPSHRWSYDLRRWVVIGLVVAGAIFSYFIRETLPILILALLVAYLLNPIVGLLVRRFKAPRLAVCAVVYLVLIASLIELSILVTPNVARQVSGLFNDFDALVKRMLDLSQQLPLLANWTAGMDPLAVAQQLRQEARTLAEQSPRFVAGAASSLLNVFLVLVISFYLLKDGDTFIRRIKDAVPEAYRVDFERIARELDKVWSGFLRGQVLLALIIGIVTTLALTILGVRSALLLGILAGILEVVPTIGPIIAMIPAVFIALFQGSTNWQIDPLIFALIVMLTYFGIQQLENHLIVPNVLGASVDLPPVVILIGTVVGAGLAGVLGIFLAAPIIATGRLVLRYVLTKLFEPLPGSSDQSSVVSHQSSVISHQSSVVSHQSSVVSDQLSVSSEQSVESR